MSEKPNITLYINSEGSSKSFGTYVKESGEVAELQVLFDFNKVFELRDVKDGAYAGNPNFVGAFKVKDDKLHYILNSQTGEEIVFKKVSDYE